MPILQTRKKWQTESRNIASGDIVLVADQNLPRNCWPLAEVVDVHVGTDGMARSAGLKTKDSEIVRPIHKLCLLEAAETYLK